MERNDGLSGPVNDQSSHEGSTPPRASLGNLIMIALIAGAAFLAYRYLQIDNVLKVLLGLSFVIFIHELGHFAVAKMCDVHVTHFSIGFGPVIPGLWFKWGETTYQVCLFPLGGYVQMVGQVDGDESGDGSDGDPRSYRNKTVGQRMAIISAGVIMNALLALICFIAIYRGPGKDRNAAVVAAIDGGAPAFVNGLRTGMEITQIGDVESPYFDDLRIQVMGSDAGERLRLVARLPGDSKPLDITIEPRKTKDDANPVIGIVPASSTKLANRKDVPASIKSPVEPLTAASRAEPPFEFGDVIIAASDPKFGGKVTPLPPDPFKNDQKDYFELTRRLQGMAGKDIVLRVQRKDGEVDITVPPAFRTSIGASMEMGHIIAVRKGSPADGKIQLPESGKKFVKGDLIEKVQVKDVDGKTLVFEKDTLDPERLPVQLKAWARRLEEAGKPAADFAVTLSLRRHRQEAGPENDKITETLLWDQSWAFDNVIPITLGSPLAIPELGLAYQVKTTVAQAKNSQLQAGDVITNIRVTYKDSEGKEKTTNWQAEDNLRAEEWARVGYAQLQSGQTLDKVTFKVQRDKEVVEIDVVPTVDKDWPISSRGLLLLADMRKQKADNTLDAIALGLQDTHKSMLNVLNGIRQMITGRLAWKKHLGGPISIARIAYSFAGQDIWEFIFFLGMISVNLAVINFLPIPLLDGGHMVFLIYEKLRGKPASEGVRVAATYVGIAFIAGLILLVSYLDIGRLL